MRRGLTVVGAGRVRILRLQTVFDSDNRDVAGLSHSPEDVVLQVNAAKDESSAVDVKVGAVADSGDKDPQRDGPARSRATVFLGPVKFGCRRLPGPTLAVLSPQFNRIVTGGWGFGHQSAQFSIERGRWRADGRGPEQGVIERYLLLPVESECR